jgi:hypothetical protein
VRAEERQGRRGIPLLPTVIDVCRLFYIAEELMGTRLVEQAAEQDPRSVLEKDDEEEFVLEGSQETAAV